MDGVAERLAAALADRYTMERELGHGGMATVYLAHDVRHNRKVALKVLRPELAAMIGAERFLKEIEVTANLQHPHILPLHDSGAVDSFLYYVMPYVEGETLRTLLEREKQLGIDRAVEITRNVAAALDYAHRRGVIHRDIKPENVLIHDGQAMVADFGIALAVSQAGGSRLTETGLSLGTPHYMSPEQAMGDRVLDARSDVYSLGAMLYEMLAGDPPYTGGTAQAIVAKVITEKPAPLTAIRDTVPPNVAAAVHKALAKLPADRFASAAEFSTALVTPGFATSSAMTASGGTVPTAPKSRSTATVLTLASALALATVLAGLGWLRPRPGAPVGRFHLSLDDLRVGTGMDISPDGSMVVVGATDSLGSSRLYLRRMDQLSPQVISSVDVGLLPAFSPDGQQIVYINPPSSLRRVSILGAPPVVVTDSATFSGHAWGRDGAIYFGNLRGELARIPATGGRAEVLLSADTASGFGLVYSPAPLPNGKGLLFSGTRVGGGTVVAVFDLASRQTRVLVEGFRGVFAEPDRLLYAAADGTLFQAPFDQDRMELTGPAEPVANRLALPFPGWTEIGVSRTGTLAYLMAGGSQARGNVFVAVTREGAERVLPTPPANFDAFSLSPDGKRVAAEIIEGTSDGGSIVTFDVGDSIVTRLTFRGINRYPAWTADGRRVAFAQEHEGERDLVWKPADGSGVEEPLLKRPGAQFEVDFSRDGRWMIYREGDANGGPETLSLRYQRMTPPALDSLFYDSPNADFTPALSPDGRWLAYTSAESGNAQVYVRPFPPQASGAVWQVSSERGGEPVWSRSGRELFYREGGWLVAAEVRAAPSFAVIARRRLFQAGRYNSNAYHPRYAVLPGDREFLMVRDVGSTTPPQAVVVLNWMEELKKK